MMMTMAFSNAARVMMSRGLMSALSSSSTALHWKESKGLSSSWVAAPQALRCKKANTEVWLLVAISQENDDPDAAACRSLCSAERRRQFATISPTRKTSPDRWERCL